MTTAEETLKNAFALLESGRLGEAESACRAVLAQIPGHVHIRHLLGVILCQDGRLEEGMRYIRAVIEDDPKHPAPHRNLGSALLDADRPEEASACLERSLTIDPGNAPAWNNLGLAYRQLGRIDEARECFNRALNLDPSAPDVLNNLAVALTIAGTPDQAISLLEQAIEIAPGYGDSYSNLVSLYEQSNRIEEAAQTLEVGLKAFPEDQMLQLLGARIERREGKNEDAEARLKALQRRSPPPNIERTLQFELGRIYDKEGKADEAFAHFERGNALAASQWEQSHRQTNPYVVELDALNETLSPPALSAWSPLDLPPPEQSPIFLIGFFRSGTTLVDTILESHGGFQVLEERPTISAVIDQLNGPTGGYPDRLLDLNADDVLELRQIYFAAVDRELHRDREKQLIDKFPANTANVALIHRLFPDARFVVTLRHPCDVCLSCYMQDFGENDLMVNFADLENTAAVYALVMGLWQTFAANLPIKYHLLKYEDMVADVEGQMRALLEFLGAEWSDRVLAHDEHALKRGRIHTPSYHQVTQPIYRDATYRWQRYREQLAPIMSTLQPAIEYFGYE